MRILLLGDSIFARKEGLDEPRINWTLKEQRPGLLLDNTAVSGLNSGALLALLGDLALKRPKADRAFLMIGVNDAARNKQVPLAQYQRNLQAIVSALVCFYPGEKLVLLSGPAVDEGKQRGRTNANLAKYAKVMEEVAAEYQVAYSDFFTAMLKEGNLPDLCRGELADGLHFGPRGYRLLAAKILEQLPEEG
ncbi:esterase [Lactobacillus nasalidis]|uniref:Esterase n=1 Tax=Lactobacillus nasalidis TaxID=2797258 RepID=A0ABQ3W520_9LACO|nr:GDSL-type esterase/lipase family protein [Lactobacillus nasalidis]GHV97980.1 esterase [Lactobacillus nasalidis]GHV99757.1 esterase [Lactobacillus nasalidis]GHW01643.1 esterase [Lactobacillus nasalidis]